MDDTIKCSGGPRGGGVDEAGYRKEVYCGAVQFMLELARGPQQSEPPKVRLLSARPKKLGFLRMKPTSRVALEFQRVAEENGFGTWGIDFEGWGHLSWDGADVYHFGNDKDGGGRGLSGPPYGIWSHR